MTKEEPGQAWRTITEAAPNRAWAVNWGIDAPWAHPVWSQYALCLYDLTTDMGKPIIRLLPGATHEFLLYALDPDTPVKVGVSMLDQKYSLLQPSNHGYQIRATDDQAALNRLQAVVDQITAEKLSPDTDDRNRWNILFSDSFPLVQSGINRILGAPSGETKH